MMSEAWFDKLCVYSQDIYCVVGAAASILAVVVTWWMTPKALHNKTFRPNGSHRQQFIPMTEAELKLRLLKPCKLGLTSILDQVEQSLTSDQLEKEREIERLQLENIYKMLSQQRDKFQIGSIEELEDQMKLYKR